MGGITQQMRKVASDTAYAIISQMKTVTATRGGKV
jgi:hypothetical protein